MLHHLQAELCLLTGGQLILRLFLLLLLLKEVLLSHDGVHGLNRDTKLCTQGSFPTVHVHLYRGAEGGETCFAPSITPVGHLEDSARFLIGEVAQVAPLLVGWRHGDVTEHEMNNGST